MGNIEVSSVKNARYIYGKTEYGTIRDDVIIRSGRLNKVTPMDANQFEKLGLDVIIDLRTPIEAEEKKDMALKNSTYYNIPLYKDAIYGITHENDTDNVFKRIKNIPEMDDLYHQMINGHQEQISDIMKLIMESVINDKKVLFHCSVGKDRTGIIALLIQLMLGLPYEFCKEDYLATNTKHIVAKSRFACFLTTVLRFNYTQGRKLKELMIARPSFIDAAYDEINNLGGIDKYIYDELKLDRELVQKFREYMIITE